jgi:hypothetical protein
VRPIRLSVQNFYGVMDGSVSGMLKQQVERIGSRIGKSNIVLTFDLAVIQKLTAAMLAPYNPLGQGKTLLCASYQSEAFVAICIKDTHDE